MSARRLAWAAGCAALLIGGMLPAVHTQDRAEQTTQPVLTEAAFATMFEQVSNWGRWGDDDQRGTLNLITPDKRKQAAAAVKSGISVVAVSAAARRDGA